MGRGTVSHPSPLTLMERLYVYALHGFLIEVLFTAGCTFVQTRKWSLIGDSNIWSLPIYGVSGLVMEKLADKMLSRGVPMLLRGIVYLIWIYFWEYSTGYLLRSIGACPWDYSRYDYNIDGLITLEYGPFWIFGALIGEKVVIQNMSHLRWHPTPTIKSFKAD